MKTLILIMIALSLTGCAEFPVVEESEQVVGNLRTILYTTIDDWIYGGSIE